jgi:ribosomal protein S10
MRKEINLHEIFVEMFSKRVYSRYLEIKGGLITVTMRKEINLHEIFFEMFSKRVYSRYLEVKGGLITCQT